MVVLNLGCGTRASAHPDVVNIDWSPYLRLQRSHVLRALARPFLNSTRQAKLAALPGNVRLHDLRRGIPFADESVDVVYHSHFLEHIERADATEFLAEVRRVLRPGGVHRIVVPDLEQYARSYVAHLDACAVDTAANGDHEHYLGALIEQLVRTEPAGTRDHGRLLRWFETALIGDARQRGETHRWMYDRISLITLLQRAGYREATVLDHKTSRIPGWSHYGLDVDGHGTPYHSESLYVEASR